jgi:hypothetical protein
VKIPTSSVLRAFIFGAVCPSPASASSKAKTVLHPHHPPLLGLQARKQQAQKVKCVKSCVFVLIKLGVYAAIKACVRARGAAKATAV